MKKLINQIWKFGIVGVICTVIDFGILTFLREVAGVHYLISLCGALWTEWESIMWRPRVWLPLL